MGDVATARPLTASQQLRKVRKPLIERKRRERINGCLNELKSLVLESLNKDEAQFSKLEKADILELALEVLKKKTPQKVSPPTSPEPSVIASKYTAGFSQCALEVARCLGTIDGVKPEVRVHLTEHLASCVQKLAKLANQVGAGNVNNTTNNNNNKEEVSLEKVLPRSPSPVAFDRNLQSPSACSESSSSSSSSSSLSMDRSSSASPQPAAVQLTVPVTSPMSVYPAQQLRLVGHVVTSSPEHVQLVQTFQQQQHQQQQQQQFTSLPQQQHQQSLPVIHLSPVHSQQLQLQQQQQQQQQQPSPILAFTQQTPVSHHHQHNNNYDVSVEEVQVRRVPPSSTPVFKPQPILPAVSIPIVPVQNVWRPW